MHRWQLIRLSLCIAVILVILGVQLVALCLPPELPAPKRAYTKRGEGDGRWEFTWHRSGPERTRSLDPFVELSWWRDYFSM